MKKLLAVAMILCLLVPCAVAENEPGHILLDLLDDMDIELLEFVKGKIEEEIEERRAELASSSDYYGIWEKAYYVDEFGDFTDNFYIRNSDLITGRFSNGVTSNSLLYVRFIIDQSPAFKLYEYGSSEVKNAYSSSRKYYAVTVKDEEGNKHSLEGSMAVGGDRITFLKEEDVQLFFSLFSKPQKLTFLVKDATYRTNTYTFDFDTSGFENLYDSLFKE